MWGALQRLGKWLWGDNWNSRFWRVPGVILAGIQGLQSAWWIVVRIFRFALHSIGLPLWRWFSESSLMFQPDNALGWITAFLLFIIAAIVGALFWSNGRVRREVSAENLRLHRELSSTVSGVFGEAAPRRVIDSGELGERLRDDIATAVREGILAAFEAERKGKRSKQTKASQPRQKRSGDQGGADRHDSANPGATLPNGQGTLEADLALPGEATGRQEESV